MYLKKKLDEIMKRTKDDVRSLSSSFHAEVIQEIRTHLETYDMGLRNFIQTLDAIDETIQQSKTTLDEIRIDVSHMDVFDNEDKKLTNE